MPVRSIDQGAAVRELEVVDLGRVRYAEALDLQRQSARARASGAQPHDLLFLVEHDPVVTMGRSAREAHLMVPPELLAARGVELFEVERGGDVTFHGPGQLVGYPVLNLRQHRQDLHWYLRSLEAALVLALRDVGVSAEARPGLTGVWTASGRKIASIGVHARDWVTWHGFALNVNTDLSYFDMMVPCGIQGVQMTSVASETGVSAADWNGVAAAVVSAFGRVFDLKPRATSRLELAVALLAGGSSSG